MARDLQELLNAAARAQMEKRFAETIRLASEAVQTNPSCSDASFLLGMAYSGLKDLELATRHFQEACEKDPNNFDAAFWLAATLRKSGQLEDAVRAAEAALKINPRSEHALNELGTSYLELQARDKAEKCFREALGLNPRGALYAENLGRALQAQSRNAEAVKAYQRALELGPAKPALLYRLGDAHVELHEFAPAAECARKILSLDPESVQGNVLMAMALIGQDEVQQAAPYAEKAVLRAPTNARAAAYYGRTLQSLGRIEEAGRQFARSIELDPKQGAAYYSLVHNKKVVEDDRGLLRSMEDLVQEPNLPLREQIQLHYALGKAHEDLREYEAAMRCYDEANRIDHDMKVGVAPFRPEELQETADFLIETFTPEFLEKYRRAGSDSELPLFVVGMMRSGTTLAEQILSSHSLVGGAGEQLFWPEKLGNGRALVERGRLADGRLRALADEYLNVIAKFGVEKTRVVDKMNTNYLLLGFLHLAYPNARIVHMIRHPVDTCLSIWATPVATGIDLCASKENVVFMYRQYLRVMEHWRRVLPENRLIDMRYEELVSDREVQTRRVVDFCGLTWDEACLSPERNEKAVKTPSVWQVRQPVYQTSVARWKRFQSCLGEFEQLMP